MGHVISNPEHVTPEWLTEVFLRSKLFAHGNIVAQLVKTLFGQISVDHKQGLGAKALTQVVA